MTKIIITGLGSDPLEVERSILEPLGCRVLAGEYRTTDELIALLADADCIGTILAPIDARVIAALQKPLVIVRYGIGVDNIDIEAAAKRGIPVCNVPDYCINEVADHTLALILGLTRQIVPNWNSVHQCQGKLAVPPDQMRALQDMTVGLVGFGRIGREVAARLLSFKCSVCVFDPAVEAAAIVRTGCRPVSLDELLGAADLVSLHCPSTPRTNGLINRDTLARMKKGALLVNASRGALVNTRDLVAALQDRRLAGAAFDVMDPEPIPKDSPLLSMDNVFITAHIASVSVNAGRRQRTSVATTMACAVRGEKLPNVVNGVGRRVGT